MSTGDEDLDQTRFKYGRKTFCFKCNQRVSFDVTMMKNRSPLPSLQKCIPLPRQAHFNIYSLPPKIIINPQILTNVSAVTKERWQQQMLRADGAYAGFSGEGRTPLYIYLFI